MIIPINGFEYHFIYSIYIIMKVGKSEKYTFLFIFIVLMLGVYFIMSDELNKGIKKMFSTKVEGYTKESFVSGQCPTTMIKDGEEIILYNPKLARIPGVNPLRMKSLQEYREYVEWQKANGLQCPILHLEKSVDAQGFPQLEIRPSFDMDIAIGATNHTLPVIHATPPTKDNKIGQYLDASRDYPPFNNLSYPSFDPENQTIGLITEIDRK